MTEELISIIMPAHNSAPYIGRAIWSVRKQSWQNWELIVINDGSLDETGKRAASLAAEDKRIRILNNDRNMGAAWSRNRGVAEAGGKWIAFLDSDDCWRQDKLSLQMECAEVMQGDFIYTAYGYMNQTGKVLPCWFHTPESVTYEELLFQNVIGCSTVLIKKSRLLPFPSASLRIHEDYACWLSILKQSGGYAYGVNKPLMVYRMSKTSRCGNKIKSIWMTYCMYRHIGLSLTDAWCCWGNYIKRSIIKYGELIRYWDRGKYADRQK